MSGFVAFVTGESFPSVSVTGQRCALGCGHCERSYLRGMLPAETPGELAALMRRLKSGGASGFLLSGGFDARGSLDLAPFIDALAEGKAETGLLVNVHPGMQDASAFAALRRAGVDCASLDLLDEPEGSRMYPLDYTLDDYAANARRSMEAGLRTVPHVTVGMNRSPEAVLDAISRGRYPRVIVNTLIGRAAAGRGEALKAETVGTVRSLAALPHAPEVVVGCMRPRGDASFERELLSAGALGMANPGSALLDWLKANGIETSVRRTCCAL